MIHDFPNDWVKTKFREICTVRQGLQIKISERFNEPGPDRYPYITIQHLNNPEDPTEYIERPKKAVICQEDDVLMTRTGNTGIVVTGVSGVFHNNFFLIDYDRKLLNRDFLVNYLNLDSIQQEIKIRAGTTTIPDLNHGEFYNIVVPLPSIAEQSEIAAILGTWDAAISTAERLVVVLRARKQAIMQRLLLPNKESGQPETRFPTFTNAWETKLVDEVFTRVTRKNTVGNTNVLTASGQHGLVSQTEYFNRSVAGADLTGYYLLQRGEFAYNRSSSEGYPYGAIKQLQNYETGIVSTLYLCFCLKDGKGDLGFYRHFFEANGLNRGIYSIAQEGARNHGLLNVSAADFFGLSVPAPDPEEQRQLSEFFDCVDQQINIAIEHVQKLQAQKRGLMQRLLRGEIRVTVDA